jgi:ribulose-5-phosphate 4-epimerase/fuculose-1-phosphate aldolase
MSAVLVPKPHCSPEEWALRVQLAAAYRVADHLGWAELIYSHISVRVPGPEHHFLINPYGLRYDEVTASNLIKINADGENVGAQTYKPNKAGFFIHSAIHMAREDAKCVWHMHTLPGMAVSTQEEGLLPIHMYAHNFFERLSYHEYEGPSMRHDERPRLAKSMGDKNTAMILRNHGLLTIGRTVPEAFLRYWRLNRACEIQLSAQSAKLRTPSKEVCEASFAMGEEFLKDQAPVGEMEFAALVRIIDQKDASYKN